MKIYTEYDPKKKDRYDAWSAELHDGIEHTMSLSILTVKTTGATEAEAKMRCEICTQNFLKKLIREYGITITP